MKVSHHVRRQFLILHVHTTTGVLGLMVKRGHFAVQIDCIEIVPWDSVIRPGHGCLVVVLIFQPLKLMHLGCSLLYYFPLLSDTEALEVIKTDSELLVDVA